MKTESGEYTGAAGALMKAEPDGDVADDVDDVDEDDEDEDMEEIS